MPSEDHSPPTTPTGFPREEGQTRPKPVHPGQEKFRQMGEQLQGLTRQQRLQGEQSLHSSLSQGASTLRDVAGLEQLEELARNLAETMESPSTAADPQPLLQIVSQAQQQVQQRLDEADIQVAQALQQAVSALAQSQGAMLESQNYSRMSLLLQQCRDTLEQEWPEDRNPIH